MVLKRLRIIEGILLFSIFGLAFYMALLPRLDYPFALHVDEWNLLGFTHQYLTQYGSDTLLSPFSTSGAGQNYPGTGYVFWLNHLVLSTGMSWRILNRLVPPLVWALIAFNAYVFGRKKGIGLEAAFFATLIPTSIRFLGPAFMVPTALGLAFFPLALIILEKFQKDGRHLFLLLLVMLSLFLIHGVAAFAVGIVINIAIVCCLIMAPPKGRLWWAWFGSLMIIPISSLLLLAFDPKMFITTIYDQLAGGGRMPLGLIIGVISKFGNIPTVLFLIGIISISLKADWCRYALVLSTTVFLFFLLYYYPKDLPLAPGLLYERAWPYTTLLIGLVAAFGLADLRHFATKWVKNNALRVGLGLGITLLFVLPSLVLRIDNYKREYIYRIISVQTYYDFLFVRERLQNQSAALLNPYVSHAFPPIAGKATYTAIATPRSREVYEWINNFFSEGATDTAWLRENKLDILITDKTLSNPDLVEVKEGLYILREDRAWPKTTFRPKRESDLEMLRHPIQLAKGILAYIFSR